MDTTLNTLLKATRSESTEHAWRPGRRLARAAGCGIAIAAASLLPACDDGAYDAEEPTIIGLADEPVAPPPLLAAGDDNYDAGLAPASWRVERTAMADGAGELVVLSVPLPGGGDGLLIQRTHPAQVRVGEPIEYTIAVENISDLAMHDIRIKEWRSQGIEVVSISAPAVRSPSQNGGNDDGSASDMNQSGPSDIWVIDRLMPGQTEIIEVTALADREGEVGVCMTVSYEPVVCLLTEVVQPDLLIRKIVEQDQAFVCDPVEVIYIIENIGTGTAEGIRVVETLPRGLTDANGAAEVAFVVPTLASGETAEQRVLLQAEEPGVYASFATARLGDLSARTLEIPVRFVRPQLEVRVDAPGREYVGRDVPVRISVRNNSEWPALETQLSIPAMADLSRVSIGTQNAPIDGEMVLFGRIEPGGTRVIELRFAADEPMVHDIEVIARAYCEVPVTQSVGVEVIGVEAARLETIDLVDPVTVGQQTVYEVRVKNQGSAESINVRVRVVLPDQMTFVSADGDSPVRANSTQLDFAPIERLAPGDVATWRVTALANAAGKTRLNLELTSDASRRPVIEQEPTTIIPAPVIRSEPKISRSRDLSGTHTAAVGRAGIVGTAGRSSWQVHMA
jgi:uncharacterized repeat protein (TIGR01451 family)